MAKIPNPLRWSDKIVRGAFETLFEWESGIYSKEKVKAKNQAELSFFGSEKEFNAEVQLFVFGAHSIDEFNDFRDFKSLNSLDQDKFYWLNFHGVHEVELIESLADALNIDRLTLRHILDTTQRPKMEEFESYIHFMVKSIIVDDKEGLSEEHLSFLLSDRLVISFQEEMGDHFDAIRSKMRENVGFIRKRGVDYLLTQLLDAILDNYFETIETFQNEINILGPSIILSKPEKKMIISLEAEKKRLQSVRKSLIPFRDAILAILNDGSHLVAEIHTKFFKDLHSNASSGIDELDEQLRTIDGLTNIYFASDSQRMNDVMRVLTTVSTIFIPLTFIAGIYGMNFQYMPELTYHNGYFWVLGSMVLVTLGMLLFFRRRGWL
ncbi:MAG: magnesium transporter [Cyclobacteriaceae bacterium]|jgi:magnesium transporter